MGTNQILNFCPTDTGTNLLTQSDYTAAAQRDVGNQPGVASSKLVNKAMRQSSFVAANFAQFLTNMAGSDVIDNGSNERLLAQINAVLKPLAPKVTALTTGSGNHNATFVFMIASGSATAGATYTNNSITYTVVETVASGTILRASGNGAPTVSGTLTKASGTGDATLNFYAVRSPLYFKIKAVGGGGGGGPSGTAGGSAGTNGGDTTFGSEITAGGGVGGGALSSALGGAGGVPVINSPAINAGSVNGGGGGGGSQQINSATTNGSQWAGGIGGSSALGGAGSPSYSGNGNGQANTGGGGSGGGIGGVNGAYIGTGGGSGAYVEAVIPNPSATYAYVVGTGGTGGSGGTLGLGGGNGGSGLIVVEEHYQ